MSDCSRVYEKSASIKEQHEKWRNWKTLMIGNIPKLQEATWSEVVVGEVGTAAPEFLAAMPFAIHVVIQWTCFENIAKRSIANGIVKSTNLKDRLLLSEDRCIEIISLPHCFVLLPKSLLKLSDLLPVFRAVRDEPTPPVLYDATATFWALTFRESTMPFSMEYVQHVSHKNISQCWEDKGLEWNHRLTVHVSFHLH
jgi:hypothetical protein